MALAVPGLGLHVQLQGQKGTQPGKIRENLKICVVPLQAVSQVCPLAHGQLSVCLEPSFCTTLIVVFG